MTASTGTTAIGLVLQMTLALTNCALRRSSGEACTGAFTRIPCMVLIHLGRQKIDLCLFQQFAAGVRQIHVQPQAHLARALGGNVNVGLEILALVDRGQHGGG